MSTNTKTKMLIVLIALLMLSTAYAQTPLTYTVSSGKTSQTEQVMLSDYNQMNLTENNLIGKTIYITASHATIGSWTVTIQEQMGTWWKVTGKTGKTYYINSNYMEAFRVVE